MNDLEITQLCAEAMGWKPAGTRADFDWVKAIPVEQFPGAPHYQYVPLRDDAQAMALVKKLLLRIGREGLNDKQQWFVEWTNNFYATNANLNRAICECAAKMQASIRTPT